MNAGQIIKNRLEQMGMTQGELASRCNVSAPYINDITKDRRTPSGKVAKTILLYLNLTDADQRACVDYWTGQVLGEWRDLMEPDLLTRKISKVVEVFRKEQDGKTEPFTLTLYDCSEEGWRVDVDFCHHDGIVTVGTASDKSLLTALAGAIENSQVSLPGRLGY